MKKKKKTKKPKTVQLPAFEDVEQLVLVDAEGVRRIEHLRVGRRVGSMLYSTGPTGLAVGVEPGAVLMRIFHVDPESAYRLGFERAPDPQ